jgi:hypothetical protein
MGDVSALQTADEDRDEVVYTGEIATADEQFLLEWARESWKKSLEQLAGGLQRLVTLNTALLGGSLVFPKDDLMHPAFRWFAAGCFLASLIVSLYFSIPVSRDVNICDPPAIALHKAALAWNRRTALALASYALGGGLSLAVVGAVLKAFA